MHAALRSAGLLILFLTNVACAYREPEEKRPKNYSIRGILPYERPLRDVNYQSHSQGERPPRESDDSPLTSPYASGGNTPSSFPSNVPNHFFSNTPTSRDTISAFPSMTSSSPTSNEKWAVGKKGRGKKGTKSDKKIHMLPGAKLISLKTANIKERQKKRSKKVFPS